MSGIGAIVVELQADIARYASSMDKAAAIAEQRMKQIDQSLNIVKNSLTTLGVGFVSGLTLDKVKDQIEGAIKSASGLQEMAERTGVAADRLSGLAAVAKMSGTDSEALATGLQKLSRSLVDAQDGGKKSEEAFRAIGISVSDLKGLKPDEAFQLIAQKMSLYADGAEKTAIAQALFGKAGANLLPVMRDLSDAGETQVVITKEQAEQANEYEKNVRRLELAQAAMWQTISGQVLPVMNAFAKAMLESATQADGIKGSVDKLAKDNSIRDWAMSAASVVGFVVDAFDGVSRAAQIAGRVIAGVAAITLEDYKLAPGIFKEMMSDIDGIMNKTLFSDRLKAQLANIGQHSAAEGENARPTPNYHPNTAAKGQNDDPARAVMNGVIKLQEQMVAAQRKALADDEAMLQQSYQQQYMTAAQFYAGKRQLVMEELQHELDAYSKEMDAAQTYINQADTEQKKQAGRNQLAQAAAKYLNAQSEAQAKLAKITDDANKPLREFELGTQQVIYSYGLQNAEMQFQLDLMGKSTLATQILTAQRKIQLDLDQRIHELKLKGYSDDELASRVAQASAAAEAQKAIVAAQITSQYDKQRDAVFGAQEAFRKYAEDAGNQAAQMENVVSGAFKGMEDALTNFVTKGKLDFASLVDSIVAGIARIVIQEKITGPLAKWAMKGLDSIFSVPMQSATAENSFDTGAMAAILGFADGGTPPVGVASLVGERGPEMFVPREIGTIVPNEALRGSDQPVSITIYATVGDVATKSDVVAGMQTVAGQIVGQLTRSKMYGGVAA